MGDSETDDGRWAAFVAEADPVLFGTAVVLTAAFVVAYALSPTVTHEGETVTRLWVAIQALNDWVWGTFGWSYLWAMFACVAFALFLALGPWGAITLGGPDAEPEFTYPSYVQMFFSAGIAAGIVFWAPAEAVSHLGYGTPLAADEASQSTLVVDAMQYTFFHWGVSAWSAYLLVGLPVAYYAYNEGAPMQVSTLAAPLVGVEALDDSQVARAVDLLALVATMGGVATTLGLVAQQLLEGLRFRYGVQTGDLGTILVLTGLTVAFTASVAVGVKRGIRWVSRLNVAVFLVLGTLTFLVGYPGFVLSVAPRAFAGYLVEFVGMSLSTGVAGGASLSGIAGEGVPAATFVGEWTVFYWGWWFAWAPAIGLFLARISRGRTVREVVLTSLLASSLATMTWFAVLGGVSMKLQTTGRADVLGAMGDHGAAVAGFEVYSALPLAPVLSALFLVLVVTFFTTSADTATLGLAMLTARGDRHPSAAGRVVWGVLLGLLASVLLVVGGTEALQSASILAGGPFAVAIVLGMVGFAASLYGEHGLRGPTEGRQWPPTRTGLRRALPGLRADVDEDGDRRPDGGHEEESDA